MRIHTTNYRGHSVTSQFFEELGIAISDLDDLGVTDTCRAFPAPQSAREPNPSRKVTAELWSQSQMIPYDVRCIPPGEFGYDSSIVCHVYDAGGFLPAPHPHSLDGTDALPEHPSGCGGSGLVNLTVACSIPCDDSSFYSSAIPSSSSNPCPHHQSSQSGFRNLVTPSILIPIVLTALAVAVRRWIFQQLSSFINVSFEPFLIDSLRTTCRDHADFFDVVVTLLRRNMPVIVSVSLVASPCLMLLGLMLQFRFECRGDHADIAEAIELYRRALELRPIPHPSRSKSMHNLGVALHQRYEEVGDQNDLTEAIALYRGTLELRPIGNPFRPWSLDNLATALHTRYEEAGDPRDLKEAISLYRSSLELRPVGHPHRYSSLTNLGNALRTRYKQVGELDDLIEAVMHDRDALELCPIGDPLRSTCVDNLGLILYTQYERVGDKHDLSEAIALLRNALELRPVGHLDRWRSLDHLAAALSTWFEHFGDQNNLIEAISLYRSSLELLPIGHPHRWRSFSNLGSALQTRFERVGDEIDLREAVTCSRSALELCPVGHVDQWALLHNLGNALLTKYERIGERKDQTEAIVLYRQALELGPIGHPDRTKSLRSLANALHARYEQFGDENDLLQAIMIHRNALELLPIGHPGRPTSLANLVDGLFSQFTRGDRNALAEAFELCLAAENYTPPTHPAQYHIHWHLARLYMAQLQDLDGAEQHAMDHYAKSTAFETAPLQSRLLVGLDWIRDAEQIQHPSALNAYEHTLHLLDIHVATAPSLPSRYEVIKKFPTDHSVNAASCALRQGNVERALELLEQGRALLWTQVSRFRTSLDKLGRFQPEAGSLVKRFQELSSLLSGRPHSDYNRDTRWAMTRRYRSLVAEWNSVVEEIRKFDGFSRFLLPPLFSDLLEAASDGPVIVLIASKYSRDAIILLPKVSPIHIPLAVTLEHLRDLSQTHWKNIANNKLTSTSDSQRAFVVVLRELWECVVSPVVNALEEAGSVQRGSRIWWCPTSIFATFPLHAAGEYRKGGKNLSQLYVSSYTPTLTALINARRARDAPNSSPISFAAIGQADPDASVSGREAEWSPLQFVEQELGVVEGCIPTPVTTLNSDASTRDAALDALRNHRSLHFSCHAYQDFEEPFQSFLAMKGGMSGRLSLFDIIDCDLSHHEFAFLSACTTATGVYETAPDEIIHLAAALQFSGVKSVVGTLWRVNDEVAFRLVARFYRDVCSGDRLDPEKAASALRRAVVGLQKPSEDIPFHELLPFVHFGI